MSRDTFDCHKLMEVLLAFQDATKYPTIQRMAPQQKIRRPQMSVVLRLKPPA